MGSHRCSIHMDYSIKKYIYELPYAETRILCSILDADEKWEELGGNYMKYNDITLRLIGKAVMCSKSPTSELLKRYGEKNGTIEKLFVWLYKMGHQRAMSVLEPYVDPKFHFLKKTYTTSHFSQSSKEKIPRFSSVQCPETSSNSLSNMAKRPLTCAINSFEYDSLPDLLETPFSEILKATNNFDETRLLGSGGFGTVYKGEWKGINVAIKRLKPKKDCPPEKLDSYKQTLKELSILKCCRHDHILSLYAVSLDGTDPCLIYELMVNGSLEYRLLCKNKTPPLTWSQRGCIAEGVAKGLDYLHTTYEKPLVHGDIKSANILLDANMKAKIGDFGLTKTGPNYNLTHVTVKKVTGTLYYLPEEYMRGKKLSIEVDSYSYGVVMLEMASGLMAGFFKPPKTLVGYVGDCRENGQLNSLRDCKAGKENIIWFQVFLKIGEVCCSKEKRERPRMQEVLDRFEEVKTGIARMNEILCITNNKENEINGTELSTMEPPDVPPDPVIPVIPGLLSNNSSRTRSESSFERQEKTDSDDSSESSTWSESESSSLRKNLINSHTSSCDRSGEADSRISPIPIIQMLQMLQVSEIERN